MIQSVVLLASVLAGVSLLVGGVIGLIVAIWAQDTASAISMIVNGHYTLIGILPIALWLALYITRDNNDDRAAYGSLLRGVVTALQGAAIGSVLGAGPVFLTCVINLPVILAGYDIGQFGPAARDAIVWNRLILAVGSAVLAAIPLGLWVHYSGISREVD